MTENVCSGRVLDLAVPIIFVIGVLVAIPFVIAATAAEWIEKQGHRSDRLDTENATNQAQERTR